MTKPSDATFGDRFFEAWKRREIQEKRDISAEELGVDVADAIPGGRREGPYNKQSVLNWRRGTVPQRFVIQAIAAVLNVDADWLESGEGSPTRTTHGAPTREKLEAQIDAKARTEAKNAQRKRGA